MGSGISAEAQPVTVKLSQGQRAVLCKTQWSAPKGTSLLSVCSSVLAVKYGEILDEPFGRTRFSGVQISTFCCKVFVVSQEKNQL